MVWNPTKGIESEYSPRLSPASKTLNPTKGIESP